MNHEVFSAILTSDPAVLVRSSVGIVASDDCVLRLSQRSCKRAMTAHLELRRFGGQ